MYSIACFDVRNSIFWVLKEDRLVDARINDRDFRFRYVVKIGNLVLAVRRDSDNLTRPLHGVFYVLAKESLIVRFDIMRKMFERQVVHNGD